MADKQKITIAAMADLHMQPARKGMFQDIFAEINKLADILVLCGDLTDHGLVEEAEMLAEDLTAVSMPVVGVLGNHDYDKGHVEEFRKILAPKMQVLDGDQTEFAGIGFAGVKGFGGGFAPSMWGRIGEDAQKAFYDESEKEAEKLENAINELQRKQLAKTIVLMHYSPIKATIAGELVELYPFLGSTKLEDVIDHYNISMVIHGHAHYGTPEGKTTKGIPVYNCSYPLLSREHEKTPYKLITV